MLREISLDANQRVMAIVTSLSRLAVYDREQHGAASLKTNAKDLSGSSAVLPG